MVFNIIAMIMCVVMIAELVIYLVNLVKKCVIWLSGSNKKIEIVKDIKDNGIIYPVLSRVYSALSFNMFNTRWQHELNAIFHVVFLLVLGKMDFKAVEFDNELASVITILVICRLVYLHIHQMNVLFFDRGKMGAEKNNIKSIPRIVLISVLNGIEIVLVYFAFFDLEGWFDKVLILVAITTGMQLVSSLSQLFNFNRD